VSKLQDEGKDVPVLHSAPNHEGVWGSGNIIQIMLSRDNKRKGVVNFKTQQTYSRRKWPWYHSTGGSTESRAGMDVLGKIKFFDVIQSGSGCFEKDKILRFKPEWV
jgi:hypothetical protein